MSDHTAIQWTTHSWNPWHGCTKVSAGCDHCYMFAEKKQYGQDPAVVVRSKTKFNDPLKNKNFKPGDRVFTCSWSDFFHKDADAWRDEAWDIIRATPHLTYQILTKRPSRIARHLPSDWGNGYPHVWLGVSAEDQRMADSRVPILLKTPAAIRFVSAEPLLAPIPFLVHPWIKVGGDPFPSLDWVIVGGESGPGARPCDLDWIGNVVDQCRRAGVACFVKQLGARPEVANDDGGDNWPGATIPFAEHYEPHYQGERGPLDLSDRKGGDINEWPDYLRVREFPVAVHA